MFKFARCAAVVGTVGLALGFGLSAANAAPRVAAGGLPGSVWTVHYTWTDGAASGTFGVTLNANHTATATGTLVKWTSTKAATLKVTGFQLVFPNSGVYACYANYDGTVSKSKSMKGLIQTDGDTTYCLLSGAFTATKDSSGARPDKVAGGGLRAAGVR